MQVLEGKRSTIQYDLLNKRLFLFGAGHMCLEFLKSFKYVDRIEGIVDDYADEKTISVLRSIENRMVSFPVSRLQEYAGGGGHKEDIVFIVTSSQFSPIQKELLEYGFKTIYFAWDVRDFVDLSSFRFAVIPTLLQANHLKYVQDVIDLLADEESVRVYSSVTKFRSEGIGDYKSIQSESEQYFERGIIEFSNHERIVDAGAFVGDTLRSFSRYVDQWDQMYCFEPDKINFAKLQNASGMFANIKCIHAAVGDTNGSVKIASLGRDNSAISTEGEDVSIQTIDSLNEKITFIKMDIEGYEISALLGAAYTIKKYKPTLAISIYHKPDDLWKIPLMVKQWVPEYHIYIRHYSPMASETIMYAVL